MFGKGIESFQGMPQPEQKHTTFGFGFKTMKLFQMCR